MTLHTLSATLVVVLTLLHCSFGLKFPISNVFEAGERLTISVFTRDRWQLSKEYSQLITQFNVTYGDWEHEQPQVEVNLTVWQSPLWAQVVATRVGQDPFAASARSENWIELMTKRKRFVDTKRYLLLESEPEPLDESVANEKHWHFKPLLTVGVLDDFVEYQQQSDLSSVAQRVYLHPTRSVGRSVRNCVTVAADEPLQPQNKFMPVMFLNDFYNYKEDYVFVDGGAKGGTNVTLKISYAPQTMVRWQWMRELNHAFGQGKANLMGDEDGDDMRRMFLDTHPYLLYATSVVSVLHLLFDFLAFKNDISFWRSRKSFEGLSLRYVMANAVMQFIIILYLANENTSRIVLIPACIGTLVECWKVTRAFVFKLSDDDGSDDAAAKKDDDAQPVAKKPFWKRISITEREASKSSSVDAQAWRFLGPFLLLGLLVYAVYSLIYVKQRNWYSWALRSLSGLVYGGGFIMMTPQLFINYRLKSVTHLPWRVFGYKAMNTFIDDLFAFVIKMPGMHRAACFRDDLVFLVYLYQRWIYRVDKSRANEYGQTFDEDADESKEESKDDDSDATKKDQ